MTELANQDRLAIETITTFWREAGPDAWFRKDDAFDAEFRERLGFHHWNAAARRYDHWQNSAEGGLALMILLDQYPRNSFRGTGHMYATDPLARHHARLAVAAGHDRAVETEVRHFFYLPFSHSEAMPDQERACELGEHLGEEVMKHSRGHRDIVARFGRFPHRNTILGRESTAEELAFIEDGGFRG